MNNLPRRVFLKAIAALIASGLSFWKSNRLKHESENSWNKEIEGIKFVNGKECWIGLDKAKAGSDKTVVTIYSLEDYIEAIGKGRSGDLYITLN